MYFMYIDNFIYYITVKRLRSGSSFFNHSNTVLIRFYLRAHGLVV